MFDSLCTSAKQRARMNLLNITRDVDYLSSVNVINTSVVF